jgi:curved DNA-binding protein CbpA
MDYYGTLGIAKGASPEEINKAFRGLALKYHPDHNLGNEKEASKEFKKINEAFEVLNNPEKKAQYDRQGYVGRKPPPSRYRPKPRPKPPPPPPKKKESFWSEPGLEKALAFSKAVTGGHFNGHNDPAHLFWMYSLRNKNCKSKTLYAITVTAARAYCEGRTLEQLTESRTDILDWCDELISHLETLSQEINKKFQAG